MEAMMGYYVSVQERIARIREAEYVAKVAAARKKREVANKAKKPVNKTKKSDGGSSD